MILISFFPLAGESDEDRPIAHPRFVLRVAGDPVDAVAGLGDGATVKALEKAAAAVAEAKRLAPATCALLEGIHPRIEARDEANALLKIKRDFYNLRSPPEKALDLLLPRLTPAERTAVETMLAALAELAAREAAAGQAYGDEIQRTFRALEQRFSSHNLRDALQRTNPFLVGQLDRLHAGERMSARDTMALNMALFAYLNRAALKTSPRSSLTLVAAGTWVARRSGDEEAFALPSWRIERSIAARFGLVERLFQPLLRDLDALAPEARLRFNPTGRVDQGALTWRRVIHGETVEQETYGIGEATSKVRVNRGLDLLLRVVGEAGSGGLSLSALTEGLKRSLPEQNWPAIPNLLQRALTHDILDAAPAVGEQVDKLVWAKSAVRQLHVGRAAPLGAALDRFAAAIETCKAAAGALILPAYRELEQAFAALAAAAGAPLSIEAARPVVHEDCTIDMPSLALRPDDLGRPAQDLPWLLRLLPLLRGYGWPQSWLTARFLEQFGPAGRCDDPEAFLLAAANELAPLEKEDGPGGDGAQLGSPPDHPLALTADRVARSFAEALAAANDGREEWHVPHDLIRDHYAALPEALRRRARSHCINAQSFRDPDGDRLMINAIYPGNARIMARFLGMEPARQADIRAYLRDLAGGDYAAIPGVFGFNANVHAPLADVELGLPPRAPDHWDSAVLPLDRLHIAYDEALDRIVLKDRRGTKIEAYYFGILNSSTLPSVHRMLDWMSGSVNSLTSLAQGLPSRRIDDATGFVVQPRISLGSLILVRSARMAPLALLPDPRAEDYRFFVELRDFCARHGIPRETFFRFQGSEVVDSGLESNKRRAPKWRKPMYLDLYNPVAVRTLQRALRRYEGTIEFAEALPGPEAARVTVDGVRHVSELSFEIGLRGC
ncbi:MAG TPA: lantibiotic dehydratase [Allosphingosinicella sp.]|nr:lantibiotic dehydratase [Allosphingosinicella sp.]